MTSDAERAAPTSLLHVRWDLDKTYLQTDFDTVKELVATFRQKAADKKTVPGATALLRELLARPEGDERDRKMMFISGSPRQMRQVLTEKLRLDGVEPDTFILKPNLSNLLLLRWGAIRTQVGYKLGALLDSRIAADDVEEILVGDDSEQDAFIYSLYADLVEGRVAIVELERILAAAGVIQRELDNAMAQSLRLIDHSGTIPIRPMGCRVRRIYIHLERRSPLARFVKYGARVVPVFNYFQAALVMFGDGGLRERSLLRVLDAMGREGYTPERLANSVQDMVRRGYVSLDGVDRFRAVLAQARELLEMQPTRFMLGVGRAMGDVEVRDHPSPPWVERIDYLELARDRKYRPDRTLPGGIKLIDERLWSKG